ncbi:MULTISPECIES: P-loop ATPase, Sll1717 family [Rhizobium/Agrobacterium group]|uniref:P-loop ATPase, Sll1717 family n=1 Tax=Rhizobium/Agrobacterium group TaxID=227290 RepID=UPI0023002B31|nr:MULTISPECIES: hypothetical protein [Rhizobium/Agrobacterium group]MDA5633839.1 hypothetical protein [Agrobacterium sp. ST15.16.024]MDF1889354.1 hypothetical protein [Rhizobium rhizogenes]
MALSERYFGDLEAFDEANQNDSFFENTFVLPSSLSMEALKNNRKFIIVGRKGSGKTSVQMHLADTVKKKGYFVHHFRFFYDLRTDDYADIAKTQNEISFSSVLSNKNLFLHYDFRDIWERVFFQKIANTLTSEGYSNKFTDFVEPQSSILSNIFDGISKTLTVKIKPKMGPIAAEIGIDLSKLERPDELPIKVFNKITRELFAKHCIQFQMYFFVDELVFSRLDAREDEITIRAAMVRDIIRTVWELNSYSYQNKMEFHFICSIRPEVRNMINDLDSESGKYLDGKDVELNWITRSSDNRLLIVDVLRKKVEYSHFKKTAFDSFFTEKIKFGSRQFSVDQFVRENMWGRPRDVVRLLIAIQKKSPNAELISEIEIKAGLDEYSRMSLKELVDELGVTFGSQVIDTLRFGIRKKNYKSVDELWNSLNNTKLNVNRDRFIKELFELGFIGGHLPAQGKYFWFHRGESYLKPDHNIIIHPGLWNELSIRG